MQNKYFDNWEFNKIIPLIETNPYEAKIRFEEYLKKYPKDYIPYPFYISTLISTKDITNAKKMLNYITNFKHNKTFTNELFEEHILLIKLKLLLYEDKYDELYLFYKENKEKLEKLNLKNVIFYIKRKNEDYIKSLREPNSYLFRQIIEYQETDFLDHIKKHLQNDNINKNTSIFEENFPINEILQEVKKYLPSDTCLFFNFIVDTYIFKYDYCGKDDNKTTNYFKVICFHNTSDIITICPSNNCEYLPYIDLNYLNKEHTSTKTKKLSQTEKFNRRFNLK